MSDSLMLINFLLIFSASTLCVGQSYILVGCTEGIIRCFSSASLGYVTSLPRPDLASVPDVTAMSYDETHSSLTVVYSDHSLVTWDVGVVTNVSMISSHNFHSSCVWSVDTFQGRNNLDLRKFRFVKVYI